VYISAGKGLTVGVVSDSESDEKIPLIEEEELRKRKWIPSVEQCG
jgi:hypothetical protein